MSKNKVLLISIDNLRYDCVSYIEAIPAKRFGKAIPKLPIENYFSGFLLTQE